MTNKNDEPRRWSLVASFVVEADAGSTAHKRVAELLEWACTNAPAEMTNDIKHLLINGSRLPVSGDDVDPSDFMEFDEP